VRQGGIALGAVAGDGRRKDAGGGPLRRKDARDGPPRRKKTREKGAHRGCSVPLSCNMSYDRGPFELCLTIGLI
jgi:hypothetical protein